MRRSLMLGIVLFLVSLIATHEVAAFPTNDAFSSSSSIIDKIVDAIGGFFRAIIDGFKDFFNTIIDAIKAPFKKVGEMVNDSYTWSRDHLGPLGIVVFTAIAGMTAYVAIFWFKQNIEQIKNW